MFDKIKLLEKPEDMSKAVLVTHKGCMDGSACVILFVEAGGKRENVKLVKAGMVEQFIKKDPIFASDKFLIFADVCMTDPKYAEMLEARGNAVVLDHHNTATYLKSKPWACIEMDACGCEILRQYLGLESWNTKDFTTLIDDHDRWLRKDHRSTDLATLISFFRQDEFTNRFSNYSHRFDESNFFNEFEQDLLDVLVRNRDDEIKTAIRKMTIKEIDDPSGGTVKVGYTLSQDHNSSLLLNEMLLAKPEIKMAVQFNFDKGSVSVRSKGDYDVSAFCSHFGGGGHKAASGHRLPQGFVDWIIEEIHG